MQNSTSCNKESDKKLVAFDKSVNENIENCMVHLKSLKDDSPKCQLICGS